jgi:hypothetical protein
MWGHITVNSKEIERDEDACSSARFVEFVSKGTVY